MLNSLHVVSCASSGRMLSVMYSFAPLWGAVSLTSFCAILDQHVLASIPVTCTAPVNIAVIKYWGKRDEVFPSFLRLNQLILQLCRSWFYRQIRLLVARCTKVNENEERIQKRWLKIYAESHSLTRWLAFRNHRSGQFPFSSLLLRALLCSQWSVSLWHSRMCFAPLIRLCETWKKMNSSWTGKSVPSIRNGCKIAFVFSALPLVWVFGPLSRVIIHPHSLAVTLFS